GAVTSSCPLIGPLPAGCEPIHRARRIPYGDRSPRLPDTPFALLPPGSASSSPPSLCRPTRGPPDSVDLWESITHGEPREGTCSRTKRRSVGHGDGSKEIRTPDKVRTLQI